MKPAEKNFYEQRLCDLEDGRAPIKLPAETLHDLRLWWTKVKWDDDHKVVSLDAYRRRREW